MGDSIAIDRLVALLEGIVNDGLALNQSNPAANDALNELMRTTSPEDRLLLRIMTVLLRHGEYKAAGAFMVAEEINTAGDRIAGSLEAIAIALEAIADKMKD